MRQIIIRNLLIITYIIGGIIIERLGVTTPAVFGFFGLIIGSAIATNEMN